MPAYCVLALDGGGLRGVFTGRLLERIVESEPAFLSRTDLIAGTSTGAILAVGLAMGKSPAEIRQLYEREGPKIFRESSFESVVNPWNLFHAKYATKPRLDALTGMFGDTTLGQLPKKVLISSFDLDSAIGPCSKPGQATWKAKFFENYDHDGSDVSEKAVDVVMRSSAAPLYFPIYQNFVDGGVVANNPAMCALAQALNKDTGNQPLQNIRLLSIGTTANREYIESMNGDWGLTSWGLQLVDMLLDGAVGLADYQCRQLLDGCYLRVNQEVKEAIPMDDVSAIPTLIALADGVPLDPIIAWIRGQWL